MGTSGGGPKHTSFCSRCKTGDRDREDKKKELARVLSVSPRTVQSWVSGIDKDAKAERQEKAFKLWLACHTQEEIAEAVNVTQQTVSNWIDDFTNIGNLPEICKVSALSQGFEAPLYNVWKWPHHTDYGQDRQNACAVNVVRRSQASQQPAAPAQSWRASFVVRNSTAAEGARATRSGPSRWPPRRNACTPLRTARRPC